MVATLVSLSLSAPAYPSFPGRNGKIVFFSATSGSLNTMNPDGSALTPLPNTANAAAPDWSPDGRLIAFTEGSRIAVTAADGSGPVLLPRPGTSAVRPAWSPHGGEVVFQHREPAPCPPPTKQCPPDIDHLMWAEYPPGGTTPITTATGTHPDWSPDGSRIAFAAGTRIYTVAPGGGAPTLVTTGTGNASWPSWSPDGSKVLFTEDFDLWVVNADGTGRSLLRGGPATNARAVWSPDGTKIAFVEDQEIYVMNANGTGATRLTHNTTFDSDPDWQPLPLNYPRPKSATPLLVSLVTAYEPCAASNRSHGPPLAFASCNPPARTSQHLTVGTGDSNGKPALNEGSLRLKTIVGNPSTLADEADVALHLLVSDVFTNVLADYTGELRAAIPLRITDRDNAPHPGVPDAATTQDLNLAVDATCAPVVDFEEGSTCEALTTVDALMPGAIKEGRRSIWQVGQVVVHDGGADGDTATADNTVFARQGVFVP